MFSFSTANNCSTLVDDDFSISIYRDGLLMGHVQTYDFAKTLREKGNCRRLENWHPRMFGSVWWQQTVGDPRQNIGEMDFTLTGTNSPILILKSNGSTLLEIIKGIPHFYL